jgi:chromosome segregation ATPase
MDVLRERLARETSDLEVTREKLNAAELTINSLNEQKNQLECQVASESATASTLKETIREGDVALKTVQQQYNDAVQKTALLEVELRSLRESVSSSSEMHGQLQAQVNAVREEKVALVSRCETLSKELEFTKQELTVADSEATWHSN